MANQNNRYAVSENMSEGQTNTQSSFAPKKVDGGKASTEDGQPVKSAL